MSLSSFDKLSSYTRNQIAVHEVNSRNVTRVDVIVPELQLHCLVRWIAGGLDHHRDGT